MSGHTLQQFTGGHPVTNDDFQHLQDAIEGGLGAVITSLLPSGVNFCSLVGAEYDQSTGAWAEGIVFYDGHIYKVDAQTGPAWTAITIGVETSGYDLRNGQTVQYLDNILREVHIIRKMSLLNGAAGAFYIEDLRPFWELTRENFDIHNFINIANYYTRDQVNDLFDDFRDGYDPTLRLSPVNSHLEWAFASPSHPDTPGTGANPWNDLGPVLIMRPGLQGLFEVTLPPSGIDLPSQPAPGFNVVDFAGGTLIDNPAPNNNFFNDRTFSAPVNGTYRFSISQVEVLQNEAIPTTVSNNGRVEFANFRIGYRVNAGGLVTNFNPGSGSPEYLEDALLTAAHNTAPTPAGTTHILYSSPKEFDVTLAAGDTLQLGMVLDFWPTYTLPDGTYLTQDQSNAASLAMRKYFIAMEIHRMYTLTKLDWAFVTMV